MLNDQELLQAYVSRGSSDAFTRLVERHAGLVYSAALRRVGGDSHRAREVAQRVFVDLARKAPRLVDHPVLAGWLHQSTHWAALGERRAAERRRRAEQAAATDVALAGAPAADEWGDVRQVLDEAMDELRPADREAILLRFFQGLSHAEIALRVGCAENAARVRVARALTRLQGILQRRGITSTAAALGGLLAGNAAAATPPGLATAFAAEALATGTTTAAGSSAAVWLGAAVANLPLALTTVIAGVLTWGLLDERSALDHSRAELATLSTRRVQAAAGVAELARTRDEAVRAVGSSSLAEPTALQLERRRLDLIVRKGELDRTHLALFRRLRLSPEKMDRLKELIVERNQAVYDALQLAKVEGLILPYADRLPLEREAAAPVDREIAALLGSEAASVRRFMDTLEFRRELVLPEIEDVPRDTRIEEWLAASATRLDALIAEREYAPGYVPIPADLEATLRQWLTPQEIARRDWQLEVNQSAARMVEIAREAAYAGKLKLSPRSERDYVLSPRASSAP